MKNKKWIFIGLGIVAVIGLAVWFFNRKDSVVSIQPGTAAPKLSAVDTEIKAKVAQNMANIKANASWWESIGKKAISQGLTTVQALANDAIWSLKKDGIIPVDTYGAGLEGHREYVKANF